MKRSRFIDTFGIAFASRSDRSLPARRLRRARAAVLAFIHLLLLTPVVSTAQITITGDQETSLESRMLIEALEARTQPLANFTIPAGNAHWDVKILRLTEDAYFFRYIIAKGAPFHLQAIVCEGNEFTGKGEQADVSLLGPAETADEFYQGNLTFAYYPPRRMPPCMLRGLSVSIQSGVMRHEWDTADRPAHFATSPARTVRHMANWARYLADDGKDARRAADFFAGALERETDQLVKSASREDLKDAVDRLNLSEVIVPQELFELQLALTSAQSAQVNRLLETRLRLLRKLAAFMDDSAALIARNQALLQRYGAVR